jgi:hypothetical protein
MGKEAYAGQGRHSALSSRLEAVRPEHSLDTALVCASVHHHLRPIVLLDLVDYIVNSVGQLIRPSQGSYSLRLSSSPGRAVYKDLVAFLESSTAA